MSNADAPDSSIVEQVKKLLTKSGTELLKPCDSTEELLGKLDRLEHVLFYTLQEYKKVVEVLLQPSKEALIANELIRHSELDVRVSVASCIGHIIRITAPDEPYGEDHMKEFFQLANCAFQSLSCMSGRAYSKAVSILQTMSNTQYCLVMLDLELYATVDHMFHLFLDGIRTSHPSEVFSNMEKIMTLIIHHNVDNNEFLLVLVKILLNSLTRKNQKVSPVSFQLAEKTLKNCSDDLKTYYPAAVICLDAPIGDYAEVVVSFFQDATQKENTGSEDAVGNVSCPGEAGFAIESDLCNVIEGNETQNSKSDENCYENRGMISQPFDDPDQLGKSIDMQQEKKPEEIHIQKKRTRRPNSLKKAEEGYDPFWMLVDWKSLEEHPSKKNNKENTKCRAKTKISKDLPPKPAGEYGTSISPKPNKMKKDSKRNEGVSANKALEPNSEGEIIVSEDQARDIIVKDLSSKPADEYISAPISPKPSKMKKNSERNKGVSANKALEPNNEGKIIASEDQTRDIIVKNHSEKGQGSSAKVASVDKSRGKAIVSEDLKEDIMTSASQCAPICSKDEALSGRASKQNPKGSLPHLKKRTARSFGQEIVGRRIKVWWPIDRMFYRGIIVCFDPKFKLHQVDYDDGEIEFLDLTTENWKLLKKQEIGAAAPSSSNTKLD